MQVVHININQPVKKITNKIVDLFTKEAVRLKVIHNHLMGNNQDKASQFTGFIA
jgi:hypothetical protein